MNFKDFAIGAFVAGAGVIGALLLVAWGNKNDIPVLRDVAAILDQ